MERPLLFALNGERIQLLCPLDPSTTLLTFIRSNTRFTGTKLGCEDGGCGACLVLLSKYDFKTQSLEHHSINSCITPLYSIHGCSITTIEGLGSTQTGFHAVQERIAGFHGSQCGFCTPGMCMSMYSCFLNKVPDNADYHTIPDLSLSEAQTAIVGNICRCTGYRPILDACKSFSKDVDIEDLGINTFWDTPKDADVNLLPPFQRSPLHAEFPDFLIEELKISQQIAESRNTEPTLSFSFNEASHEKVWVQVSTLPSAFAALSKYQNSNDSRVKVVVSNTSSGYYKDDKAKVFIDISRIPELLKIEDCSESLVVGAAVTIEKLIHALEARNVHYQDSVTQGFISHLMKVANPHVRHRASVGGNLVMAQQHLFGSDLATLFLVINATMHLISNTGNKVSLAIEQFLLQGAIRPGFLLESITLPLIMEKGIGTCIPFAKQVFKSYRAASRQLGNALALINAAFLVTISSPSEGDSFVSILDVKLAYGGFGNSQAMRVYKVERFLKGKTIDQNTLLQAVEILNSELESPLKGTKKSKYKTSVAVGFFFNFFRGFIPWTMQLNPVIKHKDFDYKVNSKLDGHDTRVLTYDCKGSSKLDGDFHVSGKQNVPKYEEDRVLGKPIQKVEGKIQAAGEAVYVDDIPTPQHCLFAAFVLSSKAYAKIKSIEPAPALSCPGVVAFISAQDIPNGGLNVGPIPYRGTVIECLFASDTVMYAGHPIGVVVADSAQHAKDASVKVIVEYEELCPILCVEDAVMKDSFFNIPPPSPSREIIGDINKELKEATLKINDAEVRTGSQYYFYMETQTALAVPDEDDCILVYSSCQSTEYLQRSLSACLGIPIHNVRVISRRAGGGYGGKAFRNITVANACAVAAYKLRRPVRMYLDRKTDMIISGGRHPTKTIYSVGFTSEGKITSLKAQIFIDSGWSEDYSPFMPLVISDGLKKYNWGSVDFDFKLCKTNLSSKSAMRAPGHIQGSFLADSIIEHVAAVLDMDVHNVITRNMHTFDSLKIFYPAAQLSGKEGYTLPSMWNEMLKRTASKEEEILKFNSMNKWCKRGLSILPCVYGVFRLYKPAKVSIFHDGSVVVEVGGIEIGQGLWTKVKQAVAYGLSPLLVADGKDLESIKIRVVQADSISLPHGGMTAGSTASESSCEAAREACRVLVDRIMPLKVRKEQELQSNVSWTDLIKLALESSVNLSAHVHWFPKPGTGIYLNYGVGATEVELDVLTGALKIIQTDIVYDCGRSMNPAVDIGQIEGCFVQGIGFFLTEEHEVDNNGVLLSNSTWTYKPPTLDDIPQALSVELLNGPGHENRVLSSKASGEPPLLLAGTVHSALRHAIEATRQDHCAGSKSSQGRYFSLDTPATMDIVRSLCGSDIVEEYLKEPVPDNTKSSS